MTINASDIIDLTKSVTKEWTKQRKAEERGRARSSRQYTYSSRVNFTEVAHEILPEAYRHASGDGKYLASKRQIYYAARKKFQELTGRDIKAQYLSQKLLTRYMNTHPETATWNVVADARGHLELPNCAYAVPIPVGTLQIDKHLAQARVEHDYLDGIDTLDLEWPSVAPGQRYQAVLYIEKEGFEPIMKSARIAERFDIAILSGKGQSTVAARKFVDHTCMANGGVPLFVLHDFDKSGFEIRNRLTSVSSFVDDDDVKYEFKNKINVTDLGLRLSDINEYSLHWAKEEVGCSRNRRCRCFRCQPLNRHEYDDLRDDEYAFLARNERVELNALTSPQFIQWLEAKLTAHGLAKRLVPSDNAALAEAYKRAILLAKINKLIYETLDDEIEPEAPATLRRQLAKAMTEWPDRAWDKALYAIAETKVSRDEDE